MGGFRHRQHEYLGLIGTLNSRTYLPAPRSGILQIEFGTGRITGPEAIDDFHIGPFSVYKQTFGMIQSEEGRVFEEIPVEGILGLAFPAMAANGIRPFVDGIIENKAIGRNEFAFYFSPDDVAGNAIFWGGVDKAFYTGDIEFFPVVEPYYWAVELRDFKIGNDSLLHLLLPEEQDMAHESHKSWKQKSSGKAPMFKAIVDTGTTFFTAQGQLYKEVMKRLSAQTCSSYLQLRHYHRAEPPQHHLYLGQHCRTNTRICVEQQAVHASQCGRR